MLTGDLKNELIRELELLVTHHRECRAKVTVEEVRRFMTPRALNFKAQK